MPASSIVRRSPCGSALPAYARSEEHTSELQSQSNIVCRLLLEKKNRHKRAELDGDRLTYLPTGKDASLMLDHVNRGMPEQTDRIANIEADNQVGSIQRIDTSGA